MHLVKDRLWPLALSGQPIDAGELASALDEQSGEVHHDFRTELLIRDSLDALASHWGHDRVAAWIAASPSRSLLRDIWKSDLGPAGFPSLSRRIMDATKPEVVFKFLRELGNRVTQPTRLEVGGSIALILSGNLSRHTEDIDVVDELPPAVRSQHDLLNELAATYGLRLTHFQSHYLPSGWRDRLHSLGRFGRLDVHLVDVYDVFVGKLFSARRKDRDDLRALSAKLDKRAAEARFRHAAGPLLAEPKLAAEATENWYILYGEALPTSAA
jgi:hypothetical protein